MQPPPAGNRTRAGAATRPPRLATSDPGSGLQRQQLWVVICVVFQRFHFCRAVQRPGAMSRVAGQRGLRSAACRGVAGQQDVGVPRRPKASQAIAASARGVATDSPRGDCRCIVRRGKHRLEFCPPVPPRLWTEARARGGRGYVARESAAKTERVSVSSVRAAGLRARLEFEATGVVCSRRVPGRSGCAIQRPFAQPQSSSSRRTRSGTSRACLCAVGSGMSGASPRTGTGRFCAGAMPLTLGAARSRLASSASFTSATCNFVRSPRVVSSGARISFSKGLMQTAAERL
ncbi:unnamed protein product [Prorocentrum cordatum]|uniref:Uncharacterized protein n=1 Tax=Prorocentrum cordatum TaxID=2364126 RepID=A0ABN9UGU8_9DINO|nr:unnamed protein product [Polarella glacialis]